MTVTLQGFAPEIAALIQQNTLQRTFLDAIYPKLLYRAEATPERWEANVGEVKIFTRAGKMPVNVKPLPVGQDPTPKSYATEQFKCEAAQYGDRLQTHMPTSRAMIQSKFLLDTQKLGENAGETINRLVRNRLFNTYLAGDTVTVTAATTSQTLLRVASLNGFLERVLNGQLTTVSPGAPLAIELGATNIANTVIAALPDNPTEPFGPGTLYLGTPLSGNLAARSRVRTLQRSRIVRVGGAATVDNLTASSFLTMDAIISAVQLMRSQGVPPHSDGKYHVHLATDAVTQIFRDPDWKALNHPAPTTGPYAEIALGQTLASIFYENSENPNQTNSGVLIGTGVNARASTEIGAEVTNESNVPVARTLITGGGAIYEEYIPEEEYGTPAGYTGKVGNFAVSANGAAVNTDRIRYILRAPLDMLQQIVDQAWSWSGDFATPSDLLTGNGARFKRAIVIEHAGAGA